ncbi:MAG: hypothetical protein ABIN89_11560 [Chitinophagaceae bacterium]
MIILLLAVQYISTSCNKDFLDRNAKSSIPEEKIFNDPALIQLFVNNMYADVPNFDHDLYDNITDESRNFWGGAPRNVVQGQWFTDNNPMEYWAYTAVRKTNMFLTMVDKSVLKDNEKISLKGQIPACHALFQYDKEVSRCTHNYKPATINRRFICKQGNHGFQFQICDP